MKRKRPEPHPPATIESHPPATIEPHPPATIESLPEELLLEIFNFVLPPGFDSLRIVLRMACKKWNRIAGENATYEIHKKARRRRRLIHAASLSGYCLFLDAARFGYEELCTLGRSWMIGADPYATLVINTAFSEAAHFGDVSFCARIKSWGATDVDGVLEVAATAENLPLCRASVEWGANNLWNLLRMGLAQNSFPICDLARELMRKSGDTFLLSLSGPYSARIESLSASFNK